MKREKVVLVSVDGKQCFSLPEARNKELSNQVAKILTYGMIGGKTDAELIAEIWNDESLSNEEAATLIFSLPTAIEKLNSLSGQLGLGKRVRTDKTIGL